MGKQAVSDSYTLYRRKGGAPWYMRFSIRGQGQQRIGLKTTDRAEAERLAEAQWHKTVALAEAGLSVTRKNFSDIAEGFIKTIERSVERGEKAEYHARQYPRIIRRYFISFFGKRAMTAIKTSDIQAYWEWRREYWISGPGSANPYIRYERFSNGLKRSIRRPVKEGYPSDGTLSKEALLLRQLFQYGQRNGYTLDVPEISVPKSKKRENRARPGFTLEEFTRLEKVSEARVAEYEQSGNFNRFDPANTELGKNQRVYFDRVKLHSFCMIAGFTGMRPTELFNLSWGDLEYREITLDNGLEHKVAVIQARGKGKDRELAAMPETLTYFSSLRNAFFNVMNRFPNNDDPVFVNNQGKRLRSFKKGLAELLEVADLRRARDGRIRDSFSFRHFYITQQIREGVGHHILSRNTGTSTKMIDAYYSKVRPTEEIKQLIPDWLKRRPFKSHEKSRSG